MSQRTILIDGTAVGVEVVARGGSIATRLDGKDLTLTVERSGSSWSVSLPDRTVAATVIRDRDTVWVAIDGEIYRCTGADDARSGGAAGGVRSPKVTAPMPGKVLAVRVAVGQEVSTGDPLVVLEAMKMETIVSAEASARVVEVHVADGAMVEPGQVLIVLAFTND